VPEWYREAIMLTFNAILSHEGIDPKQVRLVRYQDNRSSVNCTPYNLWRAGDGRLETYQRIQKREVIDVGSLLASVVATPANDTFLYVRCGNLESLGSLGRLEPFRINTVVCLQQRH